MNWKEIYLKTLKNICEANANDFNNIVEIEQPKFTVDLIENENADNNALYKFKLDDNATEEDYKQFVEYIYGYVGENVNDYIDKSEENNDMEETKIRKLLKKYGAEDTEIENFMQDLADFKEDEEHDLDIDKAEFVEDDEEYLLNANNRDKLKLTKEGMDLIINAPKMAKDELAEAIKKLLNN